MLLTGGTKGLPALLAAYGITPPRLPWIAGKYRGKGLVVCGDAAGVWDDLEAFGCRSETRGGSIDKPGFDFMTVNKLVETFPGDVEHCFSNNAALLRKWRDARRTEYGEFVVTHTHALQSGADWLWPWAGGGTSGCGAVMSGLAMGYRPVVLCGLPLDDGPHNGEPPWRRTKFATSEAAGSDGGPDLHWRCLIDFLGDAIFSMSGRTREWFGAPHG